MRSLLAPITLLGLTLFPLAAAADVVYHTPRSFPADPSTADHIIIAISDACGDLLEPPAQISISASDPFTHDLNFYFRLPDDPPVCPGLWPPGGYHAVDIGHLPEGDHTVNVHRVRGEEVSWSDKVTFTVSHIAGKSVSGAWYAPEQSGRGMFLMRMPLTDGQAAGENLFSVYWANHDADGNPTWALMTGQMNDNIISGAAIYTSGDPLAPGDAELEQLVWGNVSFEYLGCDHGRLTWNANDAGITDGSVDVVKLASPDEQDRCKVSDVGEAIWVD